MDMLRPFSHMELKGMKKALERQLRVQETKRLRRRMRNPLRAVSSELKRRVRGVRRHAGRAERTTHQSPAKDDGGEGDE
ncbi:uncharacterized protein TrAtP1_001442 [Trichoderma atroviride]|nr:hypothetical protein TrAtP1_001442 [Trichoderma atroviride]